MTDRLLTDRDYQSLATFRHLLRVFLGFSEEAARRAGITPAQHQLLLTIRGWSGPGDPSIGDVAELLVLRHHTVVELAQRATAAGLVTTVTDAEDGRRHLLRLTERGESKLAELSLLHRDVLRRFRGQLADMLEQLD